jgi:predicted TPR repeat methyltransferase
MDSEQDHPTIQNIYESAVAFHQQGKYDRATELYSQVLHHFPEAVEIHYNLGLALFELKQFAKAAKSYKLASELNPNDSDIFYNLGLARKKNKQYDEAEEAYLNALKLTPDDHDILYNLGCSYQEAGAFEQACMVYERLLQLAPDHVSAINNLAYLYHLLKRFDRARELYGRVIELDPGRRSAQHMYAALSGEAKQAPSREYVRELFDQYSEHFEENLLQDLEYNTYKTLRQAFDGLTENKSRYEHGLDLGCGTGLAGEAFHSVCTKLTGVDLSEKMIELAAGKNLYDELYSADIIDFLNQTGQAFDLIIGADVLPYLGNLEPFFSGATKCATEETLFCLSSEWTEEPNWKLQRTGRYAHNPDYISQTAAENGWVVLERFFANIRKENNAWIRGSIFVLARKT